MWLWHFKLAYDLFAFTILQFHLENAVHGKSIGHNVLTDYDPKQHVGKSDPHIEFNRTVSNAFSHSHTQEYGSENSCSIQPRETVLGTLDKFPQSSKLAYASIPRALV